MPGEPGKITNGLSKGRQVMTGAETAYLVIAIVSFVGFAVALGWSEASWRKWKGL